MSQGTGGEMYNSLEGWDYSDDYTRNSEDGAAMSVLQEDVETVLGLQAVVKSMLDDVIGGQHAQTKQLSSILGSSVLTSNKSMDSSSTTPSTTTPHRDTDMEILESCNHLKDTQCDVSWGNLPHHHPRLRWKLKFLVCKRFFSPLVPSSLYLKRKL